jgi:hypothetical protein
MRHTENSCPGRGSFGGRLNDLRRSLNRQPRSLLLGSTDLCGWMKATYLEEAGRASTTQ